MKTIIVFCSLILFSMSALARSIKCVEKVSTVIDETRSLYTNLGEKSILFKKNGNTVYITEKKPEFFSIEMFMSAEDQRVYSEGIIAPENGLTLTIWNRDSLIEIQCDALK